MRISARTERAVAGGNRIPVKFDFQFGFLGCRIEVQIFSEEFEQANRRVILLGHLEHPDAVQPLRKSGKERIIFRTSRERNDLLFAVRKDAEIGVVRRQIAGRAEFRLEFGPRKDNFKAACGIDESEPRFSRHSLCIHSSENIDAPPFGQTEVRNRRNNVHQNALGDLIVGMLDDNLGPSRADRRDESRFIDAPNGRF